MFMSEAQSSGSRSRRRTLLVSAVLVCGLTVVVSPQIQLDVCGCKNNPASLGDFDTLNASSFPPGTIAGSRSLQIPLPADGVMVFNSVNLAPRPADSGALTVSFIRNAANTPVTLLVSGNVTIAAGTTLALGGEGGVAASSTVLGRGGLGGPGAFRGGDGAYQLVNFALAGGAGLGPGGGAGGTNNYNFTGH